VKTFNQFISEITEPTEAIRRLLRIRDKKLHQQYKQQQNPPEQDPLKPV
jgi:hypothetical protein